LSTVNISLTKISVAEINVANISITEISIAEINPFYKNVNKFAGTVMSNNKVRGKDLRRNMEMGVGKTHAQISSEVACTGENQDKSTVKSKIEVMIRIEVEVKITRKEETEFKIVGTFANPVRTTSTSMGDNAFKFVVVVFGKTEVAIEF
jgi:hypothetical protein